MVANIRNSLSLRTFMLASLSLGPLSCADSEFRTAAPRKTLSTSEDAQAASEQMPGRVIESNERPLPGIASARPDTIIATFAATSEKTEDLKFSLDGNKVSNPFKLLDINKSISEEKSQLVRTLASQTYRQGTPGTQAQEAFPQIKGVLDILVVIDDSGSMSNEQDLVSKNLASLISAVGTTDWQIAVITTSPEIKNNDAVCVISLIKSTDANASSRFAAAIKAGTGGNGNEQGIRQGVIGLGCKETPWIRANSSVAVLIVSDEDNCSDGKGCGLDPWNNENHLITYVEGTMKRTIGVDAGFYGIFYPPNQVCATGGSIGYQYDRLVKYKASPGDVNFGNICDADYRPTLNRISSNIAKLMKSQFVLKDIPDAGTLVLTLRRKDNSESTLIEGTDFNRSGTTISFLPGHVPPLDSTVLASYRVGFTPLFSAVTLSQTPAADTVSVKINGVALPAGDFTVNGAVVSLAAQPPALATILVDYRLNTPLLQRFKLSQTPLANSLAVKINGVATNDFTFDAAANELVLATIPRDGALITIGFNYREGPQLSYALPISAGATAVQILDGERVLTVARTADVFTIPAADHQLGKVLTLQYVLPDGSVRNFPLAHMPLPNSATVSVSMGTCNLGQGLEIQGSSLQASCPVVSRVDFELSYRYIALVTSFTLSGISDPEQGRWKVYLNGELITDYTRQGATITLGFEPPLDAKITIHYTLPE